MQRILVIHRGSLGDFLLLLPSVAALRRGYPGARIEMLGRPEILSLACPGVADSTASVERASLVPFFEGNAPLPEDEAEYFASFDTVLAFIADADGTFERNLTETGVKNIIVRPPFPPQGDRAHVGRYLREIVEPLLKQGERFRQGSFSLLQFSDDETRWAAEFLEAARSKEQPLVAIHPGSGSEKKCWPIERFVTLARQLAREDFGVLLILGPADERLIEPMTALSHEIGCPVAHNIPLRRLAAVLSMCAAYVGNDSGVTHLAATAGAPTVAIFGPTDPRVWAPPGRHVRVMSPSVDCAPCEREAIRRCEERRCLAETSIADLKHNLLELLD
jgi:ADP-heptose:LPS heptosyltransferase